MFIDTYLSTNTYNVYYIAILIISHEVIKVKRCFNTSYDPPKNNIFNIPAATIRILWLEKSNMSNEMSRNYFKIISEIVIF